MRTQGKKPNRRDVLQRTTSNITMGHTPSVQSVLMYYGSKGSKELRDVAETWEDEPKSYRMAMGNLTMRGAGRLNATSNVRVLRGYGSKRTGWREGPRRQ